MQIGKTVRKTLAAQGAVNFKTVAAAAQAFAHSGKGVRIVLHGGKRDAGKPLGLCAERIGVAYEQIRSDVQRLQMQQTCIGGNEQCFRLCGAGGAEALRCEVAGGDDPT